jgi:DNA polymerase
LGPKVSVTASRGQACHPADGDGPLVVPTIHPSAVLRVDDSDERHRMLMDLVADLRTAADLAAGR